MAAPRLQKLKFDICVIGAGIEGSATAYTLIKECKGSSVALLEQFQLPHTRGSSHGHSRGIRASYGNNDFMTEMMKVGFQLWTKLEKEAQTSIYKKTGLMVIEPDSKHGDVDSTVKVLRKHKFAHRVLSPAAMTTQYPGFRFQSGNAVLEDDGGVLNAANALSSYQKLFVQNGGVLLDGCKVSDIQYTNENDVITLVTSRGLIQCGKLCIAAGPWTNKVLEPTRLQLPLRPLKVSVVYWRLKEGMTMSGHPNFIYIDAHDVYSVMGDEYPGHVKVCWHWGEDIDPDHRDRNPSPPRELDLLSDFVRVHLPYLEPEPSIVEHCIYTASPDHQYIIDKHPANNNIVIAAGFSGHGFKMAPVVGRIVSQMMDIIPPEFDPSHFRIDRFPAKSRLESKL